MFSAAYTVITLAVESRFYMKPKSKKNCSPVKLDLRSLLGRTVSSSGFEQLDVEEK